LRATVTVTNTGTGGTRNSSQISATTKRRCCYRAYVTVESPGFKKSVRTGITWTQDDLQVNMQMEVGGVTESVTVTGSEHFRNQFGHRSRRASRSDD
jgi:hypothetical protein